MLCSIAIVSQKLSSISQKLSPFQKHPSNVCVQLLWNGLQLERQELEPRNDTMYTEFCLFIHGVYVYTVHVRPSKTSPSPSCFWEPGQVKASDFLLKMLQTSHSLKFGNLHIPWLFSHVSNF